MARVTPLQDKVPVCVCVCVCVCMCVYDEGENGAMRVLIRLRMADFLMVHLSFVVEHLRM